MRVVCDSCQAKYQVSDERVSGKKLKIRCRRCGGTIVIRGDLHAGAASPVGAGAIAAGQSVRRAGAEEPAFAAQSVPPASDEAWFISLNEEEHGPLSREQLLDWLRESPGALHEAYLWREGLESWTVAGQVHELLPDLAADDSNAAVVAASRPPQPPSEPSPSYPSFPASAVEPTAPTGFGVDSSPAGFVSQPSFGAPAAQQSSPVAAEPPDPMIGARNENSVLFSAASLAQVAQGSSYSPGHAAAQESNPGFADGDASGLIDIRALAAMAAPSTPEPAASPVEAPAYQPLQSDAPSGGLAPFTPDTLAPIAPEPQQRQRALPLAILGAATIAAAAVVTVAFVRRPAPESAASATGVSAATGDVAGVAPTAAAATDTAPVAAAVEAPAEPAEAMPAESAADPIAEAPRPAARQRAKPATQRAKPAVARTRRSPVKGAPQLPKAAAPRKKAAAAEPDIEPRAQAQVQKSKGALSAKVAAGRKRPMDDDSLDDLLAPKKVQDKPEPADSDGPSVAEMLAGAPSTSKKVVAPGDRSVDSLLDRAVAEGAPKTKPKLADSPGRADVLKAMRSVNSAVTKCAKDQGQTGVATVKITVEKTGRVTGANVTGITGVAGSCIARAVRKAKFPEFAKPTFSVKFPFRIQ